ncbi:MAG: response regulator [Nitrospinae bacterium]|nr:response regulator [Nitrospinota bacterium]
MRIFVAEDDNMLADGLSRSLRQAGYAVDLAKTGSDADAALEREDYSLVILDIGLPGIDGFEVLRRLRKRKYYVPVLVLTARDELDDRVRGLDLGADDYLVKPFALPELKARIRALLRRGQAGKKPRLVHGDLTLDTVGRRVWVKGRSFGLTVREWNILEFLLMNSGKVVSKEDIVEALCGWDDELSLNAIEVYVSRLRSKLEDAGAGAKIRTVRGFGYLLEDADEGGKE